MVSTWHIGMGIASLINMEPKNTNDFSSQQVFLKHFIYFSLLDSEKYLCCHVSQLLLSKMKLTTTKCVSIINYRKDLRTLENIAVYSTKNLFPQWLMSFRYFKMFWFFTFFHT